MSAARSTAVVSGVLALLCLGLLWALLGSSPPQVGVAPDEESRTSHADSLRTLEGAAPGGVAEAKLLQPADARAEATPVHALDRDPRPWVEGVVVHAGGEGPLAGVELQIHARSEPFGSGREPDSTYHVATGRSGADGRFALPRSLIPPSWLRGSLPHLAVIQVNAPGFARFQAPFPPIGDAPAVVLVPLVPYPVVVGRVVDASGSPIPHALVSTKALGLTQTPPGTLTFTPRQSGNRWGRFRLALREDDLKGAHTAGETFHLQVEHPAHGQGQIALGGRRLAELYASRGRNDVDLGDVMLVPDDWVEASAPSLVEGRLIDPEGAPIRGHELRLVGHKPDPGGRRSARTAVTDREGRFRASGLPGERIAVHSVYQSVRAALHQGDGSSSAFDTSRAARLVWPMHRVRVRVLDSMGAPIPGALVELVAEGAARSDKDHSASADDAGDVRDLFARPGTKVQLLAHLPRGQVLRASVDVPERPHLTEFEMVDDGRLPGVLRLRFEPPVNFGRGGVELNFLDGETRRPVAAGIALLGSGQLEATLASGSYVLNLVGVPQNLLAPRGTIAFEVAPGATAEPIVPLEPVARLQAVALDPSAEAALRNPVDLGLPQRQRGQVTKLAPSWTPDSARLLRWDPQGIAGEAPTVLRLVHLRGGTYGVRWRWKDSEQWVGEMHLRAGAVAHIELAGPPLPAGSAKDAWLSLEPR
ncbi:MAG: hypothetical protein GC161_10925 [Planctomycetaceae bacterium]|nr:hypothetical protein [Planctomycetaceae bacterium]